MKKGVPIRLYPTDEQIVLMNKNFGCCRLIFNMGLQLRKESYAEGISVGYNETSSMLSILKNNEEYSFLKEADSMSLQQTLRDLDAGYKRFFKHLGRYPVFKSKHDNFQSYRTLNQGDNILIEGNRIKLPKLGWIKFKASKKNRPVFDHINNVTVERIIIYLKRVQSIFLASANGEKAEIYKETQPILKKGLRYGVPLDKKSKMAERSLFIYEAYVNYSAIE